jgi:hypothetical protein
MSRREKELMKTALELNNEIGRLEAVVEIRMLKNENKMLREQVETLERILLSTKPYLRGFDEEENFEEEGLEKLSKATSGDDVHEEEGKHQ